MPDATSSPETSTAAALSLTKLSTKPSLYLLDGMALVYRAYYALMSTRMKTKSGFPTGAVFGFTNTLLKLMEQAAPDYLVVAFDTKEKTFRHHQFPAYKAQRPAPPDDIIDQLPKIFDLVQGYNLKMLMKPGFEADDIIGTLARQHEHDCHVYIVTPDKDFSQLVGDSITILKPAKDDDKFDRYGREEIKTRYGVYPEHFIDMLALMGDSSDNVPGAVGIGPKTAANLINEFGSIENLYTHIDDIKKPKTKQSLLDAREHLKLARFLVTIKVDVPLDDVTLADLKPQPPNSDALFRLFDELEFTRFAARLKGETKSRKLISETHGDEFFDDGAAESIESDEPSGASGTGTTSTLGNGAGNSGIALFEEGELSFNFGANIGEDIYASMITRFEPSSVKYHLIESERELDALIVRLQAATEISFDTETTSLETRDAELVGMSFSVEAGEAFYVPLVGGFLERGEVLRKVKPVLENEHIPKIGQNLKFDWLIMKNAGITLAPVTFDSMLASYVLNPDSPHNMDDLAVQHLKYRPISYGEMIGQELPGKGARKVEKSILEVPLNTLSDYACEDADITLKLKVSLNTQLAAAPALKKICEEIEFPLVSILAEMEYEGVRVDTAVLGDISQELDAAIIKNSREIFEEVGTEFNLDSPKQLGEILFERMKIPAKKRTKTGYSTDVRVLEELSEQYPVALKLIDHRTLQKLKSTYVDALPQLVHSKTGRVHTSYNQSVAATGRLSSSNPNLQNIPIRTEAGRSIRKAFIASDENHLLLSADYSQIELRIAAELSGDETMRRAFQTKEDIHTATARVIFGTHEVTKDMRRKAKEVNFGVLYGIMPFGLSQRLGVMQSEAKKIIEDYKAKYPSIFGYMTGTLEFARERGYVETILGRRRYIADLKSRNYSIRNAAERAAINSPIQGTAADMIKIAMINIDRQMRRHKLRSKMIVQVHDELLFDADRSEIDELTGLVKGAMYDAARQAGLAEVPVEVEVGTGKNWLEAH